MSGPGWQQAGGGQRLGELRVTLGRRLPTGVLGLACCTLMHLPLLASSIPNQIPATPASGTRATGSSTFRLPPLEDTDPTVAATLRQRHAAAAAPTAEAATWSQLAASLHRFGFTEVALEAVAIARALEPENPAWSFLEATLLEPMARSSEADALYEELLDDPEFGLAAHLRLAALRLELGDAADTRRLVLAIGSPALLPEAVRAQRLALLGRAALSLGEPKSAVSYLEEAIQLAPSASSLRYPLGLAYRQTGDLERARSHLRRRGDTQLPALDPLAGRIESDLPTAHGLVTRAVTARAMGDTTQAYSLFGRALELDPENLSALRGRSNLAVRSGNTQEAVALLERLLRLAPDHAASHFNLGLLNAREAQWEVAEQHLERALDLDPQYFEAKLNLAQVRLEQGRPADAITLLKTLLEESSGSPRSRADAAEQGLRLTFQQSSGGRPDPQLLHLFAEALTRASAESLGQATAKNDLEAWQRAIAALDVLRQLGSVTDRTWEELRQAFAPLSPPGTLRRQLSELLAPR